MPDIPTLLRDAAAGRPEANDALSGRLYDELKRLARARLVAHRPGATLDTTGLVHEAYLRLVDRAAVEPTDRAHFLALAARAMRYVLLDRARARIRLKRGGGAPEVPLDAVQVAADERAVDVIALDGALDALHDRSPRLADVVEYRFFGGLTYAEIGEITGRSVATVERDWVRARLWLYRSLRDPAPRGGEGAGDGSATGEATPPR